MSKDKVVPIDRPRPPSDPPKPDGLLLSPRDPRTSAKAWLVREGLEGRVWFIDGQFFLWESPAYRVLSIAELRSRIGAFLDKALKQVSATNSSLVAFAPTRDDVNLVVDALQQLGYKAAISPSWLEPHDWDPLDCVLCANGILHVPSGDLAPLSPILFSVNALSFAYASDAPAPMAWLRFLDTLWPDDPEPIGLLQEWFGYCLTPDTRQQKILTIIGPPRSGKGTIIRVLQALLGTPNVCAPRLSAFAHQFGMAVLIGKTAAMFPDAKISGRVDTAPITESLLSISGEDIQTVPRKNLTDWTGRLTVRFTLGMMEMPKMDDVSGALVSRMLLLPLTTTFLGREDLTLTDRLLAELPSILLWAREGWLRLRARGRFPVMASTEELRQEIRELMSPLHGFLADWCDLTDPEASIPRKELFGHYTRWCKDQGRDHPGTEQQFGQRMNAAMPSLRSSRPRSDDPSRPRYYHGISLALHARTL
ncbi:MAG TPA: phage/plasmid primase, P4 family [Gemmatimonadales bacterium]|jgi:putative DNA primase/helicase